MLRLKTHNHVNLESNTGLSVTRGPDRGELDDPHGLEQMFLLLSFFVHILYICFYHVLQMGLPAIIPKLM